MDGGKAEWVKEQSRNAAAVAVEKPLEARLRKGMERWMGGGRDGAGRSIKAVCEEVKPFLFLLASQLQIKASSLNEL